MPVLEGPLTTVLVLERLKAGNDALSPSSELLHWEDEHARPGDG